MKIFQTHRSYEKNYYNGYHVKEVMAEMKCRYKMESIRINLMKWCQKFDGFRI